MRSLHQLHLSTTYERAEDGSYPSEFIYGRGDNPNRRALEECLAALEEGFDCVTFSSGMAAIASLIEALPEDKPRRVIMPNDMYFGIRSLIQIPISEKNLNVVIVDMTDLDEVEKALKSAPTGLVWMETPSNPLVKMIDIEAIAKLAKECRGVSQLLIIRGLPLFYNDHLISVLIFPCIL